MAFGSASRCDGPPQACAEMVSTSDIDLLLIYPPGHTADAIDIRNELFKNVANLGKVADIVALNWDEESENSFIESERARHLSVCRDRA
ncbi:hypothetical protein Afe04nite_56400 [Asanoa ferruginea]|nr:hypothetical protein Afe04nite_56400 [Asanoa ferruginea]